MVTIYTNVGCNACHRAMDFMTKNGVNFIEKNLADNPAYTTELINLGFRMVPVIQTVDGEYLVGYNETALRKALGI
jgi:glutaredoxin